MSPEPDPSPAGAPPRPPLAGRYDLVAPLESGGMGQVWRGYDRVLDREIAVKLIRSDMIATDTAADEFVKRFRREARITARIGHHGVPQVYDAGLDEGADRVYLVMEYVHGTCLKDFIDPARPLPIDWAAAIAAQIATVLSHAHAIPVVHRDLKPANVLVTAAGTVKVLDFGIAAVLRTDVTRLTATGSPLGTSTYMSPEQVQATQISPASDLYSLGCVLHELLTGTPVFAAASDFAMMQQHVSAPVPDPRALRGDIPAPLAELIASMLAKSPQDRPADAVEVYERLLPFLPRPGTAAAAAMAGGIPDPTQVYRRPNAPRPRPEPAPAAPTPAGVPVPRDQVQELIRTAEARYRTLIDDERYTQAAEALGVILPQLASTLGGDDARLLRVRSHYAAALLLGGDYRRALPEFEALAQAYRRGPDPEGDDAFDAAAQAAYCRAELGQTAEALRAYQDLLVRVQAARSDADERALEVRRAIGVLLLAGTRYDEAAAVFVPLLADLRLLYGEDHEDTQEVAALLHRLHLARPGA